MGKRFYNLVCAFLGWVGAVNSLVLGFYLVATGFAVYRLFEGLEYLFFQACFGAVLSVAAAVMLVYGSYLLWRQRMRKGGLMNFIAGIMLGSVYVFFTFFSEPLLLFWLWPFGCFLFLVPLVSGFLGFSLE